MEISHDTFRIPEDVVYLNHAGHCSVPTSSEAAGIQRVSSQVSPWNGYGDEVSEVSDIRIRFAEIINAPDASTIALTHSTSLAISTAAYNVIATRNLSSTDSILLLGKDMASAVMPWQHVARTTGCFLKIVPEETENPHISLTDAIIDAIDEHVQVICLPHVHWCNGTIIDLERVTSKLATFLPARRPLLIVDGTQSIGALPFDVQKIRPSFVACSIHKWLNGPFGMSLVYLDPALHHTWEPIDHHERNRVGSETAVWDALGAMDPASGYSTAMLPGARRLDSGGHTNPITVAMIRNSLSLVLQWGPSSIQQHCRGLTDLLAARLSASPAAPYFSIQDRDGHCGHIVGLKFTDVWRSVLPESSELDWLDVGSFVCNRLKKERVFVVMRGGYIRVSVYLYNTVYHMEKCVDALCNAVEAYRLHKQEQEAALVSSSAPRFTILITGAAGWLGQFVWQTIQQSADLSTSTVVGAYHDKVPDWIPEGSRLRLDLEDEANVREAVGRLRPDCVLHLAALSSPVACAKDPSKASRVNSCAALVAAIRDINPDCALVFTSTDLVYDGSSPPYACPTLCPATDADALNAYGQSKLEMERLVSTLQHGYSFRLSNMIGPAFVYKPNGVKFLQFLYGAFKARENVGLKDDEVRSFVYVQDVVSVLLAVARLYRSRSPEKPSGRVFNMGGPVGLSRLALARVMADSIGCRLLVEGEEQACTSAELVASTPVTWTVHKMDSSSEPAAPGAVANPKDVSMDSSNTANIFGVTLTPLSEAIPLCISSF